MIRLIWAATVVMMASFEKAASSMWYSVSIRMKPEQQDHERRAGGEGGGQEAGPQERVVPEGPGRQPGQEEGRDHVDAHGPEDGDVDPGTYVPFFMGSRPV
jgi:hypothetical protein